MEHVIQDSLPLFYEGRRVAYARDFERIARRHRRLAWYRILSVVAAIASFLLAYRTGYTIYMAGGILLAALFLVLVRIQQRAARKKDLLAELVRINEEEAAYLQQGALPFADGAAFRDPQHPYADDLDLFGDRSLYQHLNRTATHMGTEKLAAALARRLPAGAIPERQQAVQEAAAAVDERHLFGATASLAADGPDVYRRLVAWSEEPGTRTPAVIRGLAYLLPAALALCALLWLVTRSGTWQQSVSLLFSANLFLFLCYLGRIKKTAARTAYAWKTLAAYATLLRQIEAGKFTSAYLVSLQQRLKPGDASASRQVAALAAIHAGLEHVQNPFAAMAMNGIYLYHIHALMRLEKWKKAHGSQVRGWLDVIGELECIYSLANQKYNNPGFCFPALNDRNRLAFGQLGHPLIHAGKRICNDVVFDRERLVVLTGSNMSGKSTFLRTLGINLVLAGAGGAICAATADLHPVDLYVSMRQTDSLADNESYFFAEVKRLRFIISRLEAGPGFVLLDEILRGTNSDDKRSGTVGMIERLVSAGATGVVATHDLEVCAVSDRYPGLMANKCFEVSIADDELVFDYTLRDGICRNKSATFIMKKMGIIV